MKLRRTAAVTAAVALSVTLLSSCSGRSTGSEAAHPPSNPTPPHGCPASSPACPSSKLHLYVLNLETNTITSYPVTTKGGNVHPTATISANNGSLSHPANAVFDTSGNLWVGNETTSGDAGPGSIVEFTPTQLARSGSPVPHVTISPNSGSLDSPEPTAFDAAGNLWVANARSNTIVKFTPAQLATSGSPIPQVTISSNNGSLTNPFVLAFDRSGDLWVTNRRANNIVKFTPPQLATSGSPVPQVTISSTAPPPDGSLYYPYTPVFDSSGDLWVTNQFGDKIVEFTPAQLATSGSPVPNTTVSAIKGSLDGPVGAVFDPSSGNLWVANCSCRPPTPSKIYTVVKYAPAQLTASGNPLPAASISGAKTGLNYPVGAAIGP